MSKKDSSHKNTLSKEWPLSDHVFSNCKHDFQLHPNAF